MSLLALVPLSPDAAEEVTRVHLAARAAYSGQPTEQNGRLPTDVAVASR